MSKPFADIASTRRCLHVTDAAWPVVALVVLTLAACGASTPRQAGVQAPAVVTPGPAAAEQNAAVAEAGAETQTAAETKPESSGRRRDRRASSASSEPSSDAGAPTAEPILEMAQQSYGRALTAMQAEDWLGAEIDLEQLVHDYPMYSGPEINLAIVYMHDKRDDDARAALDRALAIAPDSPQANNQLGILLRRQGKFEEAEQAYRRALAADPSYALAHYNLGVLLDVYLRKPDEALEHYETYQSSLPEPDKTVAGWIIDLRRRTGKADASRVAKEDGQ